MVCWVSHNRDSIFRHFVQLSRQLCCFLLFAFWTRKTTYYALHGSTIIDLSIIDLSITNSIIWPLVHHELHSLTLGTTQMCGNCGIYVITRICCVYTNTSGCEHTHARARAYKHTHTHIHTHIYIHSARPYESWKKCLRAGPPEMPLRNWYNCGTNHFHLTSVVGWKWKYQLDWVIKPVPHDLVRRIRFWRIKISGTWY